MLEHFVFSGSGINTKCSSAWGIPVSFDVGDSENQTESMNLFLPDQCIKDIVQFLTIMKMLYLLIQKVTLSSAESDVAFGWLWYTCNPDTWEYNSKSSFFLIRCHFEFIFEILFSFSRVTAAPSRCLPFLRGKTGDCDTHTWVCCLCGGKQPWIRSLAGDHYQLLPGISLYV